MKTADTRTPEEIRALMEQDGPGEPMTITEAIRQRDEWRDKTATWQGVCDKLNERIKYLEIELDFARAKLIPGDPEESEPT